MENIFRIKHHTGVRLDNNMNIDADFYELHHMAWILLFFIA